MKQQPVHVRHKVDADKPAQQRASKQRTPKRRRRSLAVAAFGTVIEWYDFSIFFYVSTQLTRTFFHGDSNSLLLTLGVGAAGFLFRPLGAMVFGHLGERIGRKQALVISAVLMAVAMFGIAVLPGYDVLGVWAGILLVTLRCLAGFSVGAEYTGIMVYLMESAKQNRRGVAASWAAANSELGSLLAVGGAALLAHWLTADQMSSWGWRILFVVGGLLAAAMIPLRRFMEETETFEKLKQAGVAQRRKGSPLIDVLKHQPKAVLVAFLFSSIGSVTYFLNITNVPTYLESTAEVSNQLALNLGAIAAVAAIIATPFIGLLSDKFGRRAMTLTLGLVLLVTTLPAYLLLAGTGNAGAVTGVALLAVPAAGWSAIGAAAIPEQFSALGRFAGMAIGYNIATVLFGGFSPLVAAALIDVTGNQFAPAYYATAIVVLFGIPLMWLMRDMAGKSLEEVDRDPVLRRARAEKGRG
ncbi:MFS transporter [Pseudoglutamicibacter cumminsii]|uniref:MFS transporter n=1 Tax=Pseudoglutamicibacter cumminsii TaxID=156979 RepID=UPI0021A62819|nr:MFS transporter [Pseudoglutamicibacter cumminsii]MCT1685278.1 MFS transporter [Pseudoglutamicibacter cumminsii]